MVPGVARQALHSERGHGSGHGQDGPALRCRPRRQPHLRPARAPQVPGLRLRARPRRLLGARAAPSRQKANSTSSSPHFLGCGSSRRHRSTPSGRAHARTTPTVPNRPPPWPPALHDSRGDSGTNGKDESGRPPAPPSPRAGCGDDKGRRMERASPVVGRVTQGVRRLGPARHVADGASQSESDDIALTTRPHSELPRRAAFEGKCRRGRRSTQGRRSPDLLDPYRSPRARSASRSREAATTCHAGVVEIREL